MKDPIMDVTDTVRLSTNGSGPCKVRGCGTSFDLDSLTDSFTRSINHYINEHQYRLLHVGQETEGTGEDQFESTVAILGK